MKEIEWNDQPGERDRGSQTAVDEGFMNRALELAARGIGRVNPNPLVGAVIVRDGRIIGEGWHESFGGPHAEVNAINRATEDVRGATLYVTLEPCSHHGKTPPCAELIQAKGFGRVVAALTDPNPLVGGRGFALLREAGIEVTVGILEDQARRQNEIFLHWIQTSRPWVVLKTAMTLDGKIATSTGASQWITGSEARHLVHETRHRLSAIMTGIGTVLADDPSLTCRREQGREEGREEGRNPLRIIIDPSLRIPLSARVLNLPGQCLVAAGSGADPVKRAQLNALAGVEVIAVPAAPGGLDLNWLITELGQRGIDSILLEGGGALNWSMLQAGLVHHVMAFIAPKIIGGRDAPTPVGGSGFASLDEALPLINITCRPVGADLLIEGDLPESSKGGVNLKEHEREAAKELHPERSDPCLQD